METPRIQKWSIMHSETEDPETKIPMISFLRLFQLAAGFFQRKLQNILERPTLKNTCRFCQIIHSQWFSLKVTISSKKRHVHFCCPKC